MTDRTICVWATVAATIGAVLHAAKGAILLINGEDPSYVPAMITFFAIGLIGYSMLLLRLEVSLGARTGLVTSVVTLVAGLASIAYLIGDTAPEFDDAPTGVKIAYAVGTFGTLVALLAIAIAAFRNRTLSTPLRVIPLVAAIVWFPFEGLTEVLPDGWGLLFAGLAWLPIAYCIWATGSLVTERAARTAAL